MIKGTIYGVRPVSIGRSNTRYVLKSEDNQFFSVMLATVEDPNTLLGTVVEVASAEPASDRHVRLVTDPAVLRGHKASATRAATAEAMLEQLSPSSTPLVNEILDEELEI